MIALQHRRLINGQMNSRSGLFYKFFQTSGSLFPLHNIGKKVRFLGASVFSTAVDYLIFFFCIAFQIPLVASQVIAQFSGFATNFTLQRNWVFRLNRTWPHVLTRLGVAVPAGLAVGALSIYFLSHIDLLYEQKLLLKIITSGVLFVYNYISRQWVFEKKEFR